MRACSRGIDSRATLALRGEDQFARVRAPRPRPRVARGDVLRVLPHHGRRVRDGRREAAGAQSPAGREGRRRCAAQAAGCDAGSSRAQLVPTAVACPRLPSSDMRDA